MMALTPRTAPLESEAGSRLVRHGGAEALQDNCDANQGDNRTQSPNRILAEKRWKQIARTFQVERRRLA